MRVPRTPDVAEPPPPPYTPSASDILTPPSSETTEPPNVSNQSLHQLGAASPNERQESHAYPFLAPANYTSAADYFSTRPFTRGETLMNEGVILPFLTKPITFIPSTRKDQIAFPEPMETFFNRDVTFKDWNLFKDLLLPQNAASFENEKAVFVLTPSQQEHVRSVLADWNKGFFRPRRICIEPVFDGSSQAPSTEADEASSRAHVLRRSNSMSSVASSATHASSVSSISSIDSSDIESVPPATIRDLLTSIRSDPLKKQHLRDALQELRLEFRATAQTLPPEERKELRRTFKREHRELARDIRKIVREARQQQREERRTLRRRQREARRASRHNTVASQNERANSFTLPYDNVAYPHDLPYAAPHTQAAGQPFNASPPPVASSSRAPTTASEQQRRKGFLGSAMETMNQFAKACEDACDLGEKHAVEVAKKIDEMIEEGERKLRGTSF